MPKNQTHKKTYDVDTTTKSAIKSALDGDKMSGFEEIYTKFHPRVYAICLKMLKNEAIAKDITQDVFIKLSRKLNSFRYESEFTTWLQAITMNEVLMYLRKSSVKRELIGISDDIKTRFYNHTCGRECLNINNGESWCIYTSLAIPAPPMEDRIAIESAVNNLPPGYRTHFLMHDLEGYEHDEIAEKLKCSSGTSKSQLHKARLRLRHLIQQRVEHPPQRQDLQEVQ